MVAMSLLIRITVQPLSGRGQCRFGRALQGRGPVRATFELYIVKGRQF
jgi:hypothetical protein